MIPMTDHLRAGIRFVLVTGAGYGVQLGLYWLLLALGVHYLPAAVVGFSVAWVGNLFLHRFWTFSEAHGMPWLCQARRSVVTSLGVLGANVGLLAMIVHLGIPELPAQVVTTAMIAPASYFVSRAWTFAPASPGSSEGGLSCGAR